MPRCFQVESLEARNFMDASSMVLGGVWRIAGTSGDDVIVVQLNPDDTGQVQVIVNGQIADTRNASAFRSFRIVAGKGNDAVQVQLPDSMNTKAAMIYGGDGDDRLTGGPGADRLYGGKGNDALDGQAGNDLLSGDQGDDTLSGNDGNDRLVGAGGQDVINGGADKNTLLPGPGKDWVYGLRANNHMTLDKKDVMLGDQESSRLDSLDDAALRQQIIDAALSQWGNVLGTTQNHWGWGDWYYPYMVRGEFVLFAASTGPINTATSGNPDHSTTNTQVDGVDEADVVKTDGRYIYTIANSDLVIVDASSPDQLTVVSRTPIEGSASSLLLIGDKVAVISQTYDYPSNYYDGYVLSEFSGGSGDDTEDDLPGDWIVPPITDYTGKTKLTVVDVSDHSAPTVVNEEKIEGSLRDAKLIADQLYLVLQNQINIPGPAYRVVERGTDGWPVDPIDDPIIIQNLDTTDDDGATEDDTENTGGALVSASVSFARYWPGVSEKREYETRESYIARLQATPLSQLLPMVQSIITAADGTSVLSSDLLSDPSGIYLPEDAKDLSLLSIARFDLGDESAAGPAAATSVLGSSSMVYASTSSLYVVDQSWDQFGAAAGSDGRVSHIFKFDLTQDDLPLVATGVVAGWALNSYALDEYQGNLRIATTSGWGLASTNNIFVLGQVGEDLLTQGAIVGLAGGESIYAVRFMGDRGFVVTFRRTDPLWALDLSDPHAPVVAGELHVPGYSTYLHPIDENHFVAVGRNADDQGRVTSLQLSLFDISDLATPTLVATLPLTDNGTWWSGFSEAEYDPHAFSYFAEQGIVALPVYHTYWSETGGQGMDVIKVDPETGFTLLGEVAQDGYNRRSIRIGGVLFAVSSNSIIAVDLQSPSTQYDRVSLIQST